MVAARAGGRAVHGGDAERSAKTGGARTGPTATSCWCMRRGVRRTSGRRAMAKFVPAGSDLVFQMHYTTNGHAGSDQTSVGLIFAKQPPAQRVLTLQLTNDHFVIPPGVPDYRVEARARCRTMRCC